MLLLSKRLDVRHIDHMALKTPYYYVRLADPLSSDEWFAVVGRMKNYMLAHGFEIDEFGDSDETDREAVRAEGASADFERQVVFPKSAEWKSLLRTFFAAEALAITKLEIEE